MRFVTERAFEVLEDSFGVRQLHGGMLGRRMCNSWPCAEARWSPISPRRTLGRRCRFGANARGTTISALGCDVVAVTGAAVSSTAAGADGIEGSGGGGLVSGSSVIVVTVAAVAMSTG